MKLDPGYGGPGEPIHGLGQPPVPGDPEDPRGNPPSDRNPVSTHHHSGGGVGSKIGHALGAAGSAVKGAGEGVSNWTVDAASLTWYNARPIASGSLWVIGGVLLGAGSGILTGAAGLCDATGFGLVPCAAPTALGVAGVAAGVAAAGHGVDDFTKLNNEANSGGDSTIPAGSKSDSGTAGKKVSSSVRNRLFPPGEATPTCSYCQQNPASHVDHVIPRSQGGDLSPENTTPACGWCNLSKGARPAPVNPPAGFVGEWPPDYWPSSMKDWWNDAYGDDGQ
jgi:hypothetical protein